MTKRNIYLNTIPVEEAFNLYKNALKECGFNFSSVEEIDTIDALGRVTSEAVFAKCNSPLYNAAAMDGICVESRITKDASEEHPIILKLGKDYKIVDTGDAIKEPYDAVIMAEDVVEVDDSTVKILSSVAGWENVRPVGEDIVTGEMILESNHTIRSIDIGALLAGGVLKIKCYKKTSFGVIPTGDEIINPYDSPKIGDIIDSNSYMIKSLVEEAGGKAHRYDIVKDNYDSIKEAVLNSVGSNDITIINAGSSAGTEDYTVHVLREIGKVIVHGVSMKPGKPVILAIVNDKPVIGLPGYPLSTYLAFDIFIKGIFFNYNNQEDYIDAVVSKKIVSSLKHREYVRVKIGKVENKYIASPLSRGAASQMSMVKADGLLIIPQNSEGIEAGETSKIVTLKNKSIFDKTLVSIGSHDILMDIVADYMNKFNTNVVLSSTHVGSLGGLMALKRGETVIAPTHLLDEKTGRYNVDILKELFGLNVVSLIKGFDRIQGIIVKKGNPLGIKDISDLPRYRFVNRQRGAGTRVLLDYKLKKAGIDPYTINGYDKEVTTHMAVAASVASPYVDCGLGVKSAADSMGLDFIQIGIEEYDFAVLTKNLNDEKVIKFINIIKSDYIKNELIKLGGYGFSNTGKIVNVGN